MELTWQTLPAFADAHGVSRQAVLKVAKSAVCAQTSVDWRGLQVQSRIAAVHSRGGSRGTRYEIAVVGIPTAPRQQALTVALRASEATISAPLSEVSRLPPALPRSRVVGAHEDASWRLALIQPIRWETDPRSSERATAIKTLAGSPVRSRSGRLITVPERTIREWISRYEAQGLVGLMRKAPANGGKKRVYLTRSWDAAMRAAGATEAAMADAITTLRDRVRAEWKSGTPSWPTVQLNCLPLSVELARKAGICLSDAELHRTCVVPRRFIEAERRYTIVAMMRKDAAKFAAVAVPRINRERSNLRPGDWVAADVHHVDLLFQCPDGRVVTPKAVAWLDLATNRARLDFFIMPKGEMIRREHVVQSFVAMCSDPAWGVPSRLYTDNGGEYNWAELASDLAKLKHAVEMRDREKYSTDLGTQRARPYNPQGKVIEGLFSNLERVAFSQLPGWIGGNRMRQKTANQGRPGTPFAGDEARLREALATAMAYYHVKPQTGHLAGQSPDQAFAAFVQQGWTATVLDPWEMAVAFSQQTVKPVRTGGTIRLDGQDFQADELQSHVGHKVLVRQPMFGDRETLFVFSENGTPIGTARPDTRYAFGDPAGAGEQARRAKALNRDVRILEAEGSRVPAGGEQAMADVVALRGPAIGASTPGTVIRINPEFSEAAQKAKSSPAQRRTEADRKLARQGEKYAFLHRLAANGG